MAGPSFYFYDFETWGTDPSRDWPAQFAGIRTDYDFNEIDEPLELFCRLPVEQLPHPEAALITGLTPDEVNAQALPEAEFIQRIHEEFATPHTCVLGYNSLRFDDEVVRYSLYRNFIDPYGREWQNGCSRWDLLDVARMISAFKPEGINWPVKEDGTPSFKLEDITAANGIAHADAHDAVSDVRATIALARLLKEKQPQLFDYALKHKTKQKVSELLHTVSGQPRAVAHISGMYSAERGCLAVVLPLIESPGNRNAVIVYDLSVDPEPLLRLSAEEIKERLYTRTDELSARGLERIPLKAIHINKCPVVVHKKALLGEPAARLKLDFDGQRRHYDQICADPDVLSRLRQKLKDVYSGSYAGDSDDPEHQLYGRFIPNGDKPWIGQVRSASPDELADLQLPFQDERLPELFWRYRARNWPDCLNEQEKQEWRQFERQRLGQGCGGASLTLESYFSKLDELQSQDEFAGRRAVLEKLRAYGERIKTEYF